jgi:hypothetical protein
MRSELKALRASHPDHQPVSKMKKNDISQLIQRMKLNREEIPSVAQTPAHPDKAQKSAVESIKEAKMHEFPVEPVEQKVKKSRAVKAPAAKEKAPKPVAPKKSKGVAQDAEAKPKSSRPAKGSPEMKARMDAIRAKKGKKAE